MGLLNLNLWPGPKWISFSVRVRLAESQSLAAGVERIPTVSFEREVKRRVVLLAQAMLKVLTHSFSDGEISKTSRSKSKMITSAPLFNPLDLNIFMHLEICSVMSLTEISGVSSGCQQGGCLTCSDYNGCLSCKPRFFMHLERIGMKQIGVCVTSCPPGFYGTRFPERSPCTSKRTCVCV